MLRKSKFKWRKKRLTDIVGLSSIPKVADGRTLPGYYAFARRSLPYSNSSRRISYSK